MNSLTNSISEKMSVLYGLYKLIARLMILMMSKTDGLSFDHTFLLSPYFQEKRCRIKVHPPYYILGWSLFP